MMRRTSALCLLLAPIALAVATGVDPALGNAQGYGVYRAHPDAILWHSVLLHWTWVLFVPGLLGLLAPIRDRGRVLGGIAWVAVTVGLVSFAALMMFDLVLLASEQNLPDDAVARVNDAFMGMPVATFGWQIPGLLGWALSLLLAPIAAARAGVIRWWVAATALAGTVLYFLFAISPVPLCLIGPAVMTVGYALAARDLLRAPSPSAAGFPTWFGRAGMVLAPLAFAAGMASVPDATGDLADAVAHPLQTQLSALLLHLAWVLFIPAIWTLAQRGRPVTRVAGVLTIIGLAHFSALMIGDSADLAARQTLDAATADAISETLGGYPLFTFGWALLGMVLTFLGLLTVTISAAIDRVVGWPVPALTAAGLAGFFLLGLGPIGVVGPLLLLAAFGLAARSLVRPVVTATPVAEPVAA